ncbi:MAG: VOC family protein [Gammaproteobacteria bacterium]|nr:VOC family protein [Gammaproteobacteria bacterium]
MSVRQALESYILGLQHIGYIVDDLDVSVAQWQRLYGLNARCVRREPEDPGEDVATRFAFIRIGESEFELIEPVSPEFRETLLASPAAGGGLNHIAWRVSDIVACAATLAEIGVRPGYVTPQGIVSFGNRKLLYLEPTDCDGHLVELIQIDS